MTQFVGLDEVPLHSPPDDFEPGIHYACLEPERPADSLTMWDYRCRACALHAWTSFLKRAEDDVLTIYSVDGGTLMRAPNVGVVIRDALAGLHDIHVDLPEGEPDDHDQ